MNFRKWCKVDKNIGFGIKVNGFRLLTNIKILYKGKTYYLLNNTSVIKGEQLNKQLFVTPCMDESRNN